MRDKLIALGFKEDGRRLVYKLTDDLRLVHTCYNTPEQHVFTLASVANCSAVALDNNGCPVVFATKLIDTLKGHK